MTRWEDIGIVVSEKKHGDKYKIVYIFTKEHGMISAMTQITKNARFAMFSEVEVEYSSKSQSSIGFWKLKSETQNWIYIMNSKKHLIVCQSICFILKKLLPQCVPHKRIFEIVLHFLKHSSNYTNEEVLAAYAYFEYVTVSEIGFSMDHNDKQSQLWKSWNDCKIFEHRAMTNILDSLRCTGDIISKNLTQIDNFFRNSLIREID